MLRNFLVIRRFLLLIVVFVFAVVLSSKSSITNVECSTNPCTAACQAAFIECLDAGNDLQFCKNARTTCLRACLP